MHKRWKKHLEYLESNVHDKTLIQMSKELNIDQQSLRLFLHNHKRFKVNTENNLILRLLTSLIAHPEYFNPSRKFYEATQIGQRRWWQLYKGERIPTEDEYMRICRHLNVDGKTHLEARQLNIFEK